MKFPTKQELNEHFGYVGLKEAIARAANSGEFIVKRARITYSQRKELENQGFEVIEVGKYDNVIISWANAGKGEAKEARDQALEVIRKQQVVERVTKQLLKDYEKFTEGEGPGYTEIAFEVDDDFNLDDEWGPAFSPYVDLKLKGWECFLSYEKDKEYLTIKF